MNLLDVHHPDIVFGFESWLKSDIVFQYVVYGMLVVIC